MRGKDVISLVNCPHCHAKIGELCKRPSGRKISADYSHSWRWNRAVLRKYEKDINPSVLYEGRT